MTLINGLIFGFIVYAIYNLTNLATLRDWPMIITVVDLIWGTFLGGIVSLLSYLVSKSFL